MKRLDDAFGLPKHLTHPDFDALIIAKWEETHGF
jgi:hypothetical protein